MGGGDAVWWCDFPLRNFVKWQGMTRKLPNSPSNERLKALFKASGFRLATAMTLFNRGARSLVSKRFNRFDDYFRLAEILPMAGPFIGCYTRSRFIVNSRLRTSSSVISLV